MYIIAGLGNPGKEYDGTRHNVGFSVVDRLAAEYNISMDIHQRHRAVCGKGIIGGEKVLLVKPLTYMNLSGESIRSVIEYYKADVSDLLVIFDDICLEPGHLRLRAKGSAGGHNGIKSIIANLGRDDFKRIKFGVGDKPRQYDLADWVLSRFPKELAIQVSEGESRACEAVRAVIEDGINQAMNKFNG